MNLGTIEEDVHENIKNIMRLQMKDVKHDKLIEDGMEAQQALSKVTEYQIILKFRICLQTPVINAKL